MDDEEEEAELKALDDSAELLPPELLLLPSAVLLAMVSESGRVITELAVFMRVVVRPPETSLGEEEADLETFIVLVVAAITDELEFVSSSVLDADC